MRWVFVTTVAGTLVAANAVAAQTTSAPPAAPPAAPSARQARRPPAHQPWLQRLERLRQVGSPRCPRPQSTALPHKATSTFIRPPASFPIRRRAQRHPMLPHRGKYRQAGLLRGGYHRRPHRGVERTTEILSAVTLTSA